MPFNLLFDDCDITVAVDIIGTHSSDDRRPPNFLETMLGTFQIMQRSIIAQQLTIRAPDIYLTPNIQGVRILEFNKVEQIFAQSLLACQHVRTSLGELVSAFEQSKGSS